MRISSTNEFIRQLESWELLEEKIINITNSKNEKVHFRWILCVVNEEKLKHLSKKEKMIFVQKCLFFNHSSSYFTFKYSKN